MQQEKGLRYFPIALFSSVMGISGVAISARLIENMYGVKAIMSTILLIIATILFLWNSTVLVYRYFNYQADVIEDFQHPVKMNFFGAISISLLLLGVLFYDIHESVSLWTWLAGVLVQIVLTLAILSKLIWVNEFNIKQFNPAWFIPIVGNIVVPLAGVYHVSAFINWIFFSIGLVFSIVYFTIFMIRVMFYPPLPSKLMPTFFILLAPPGIGFVSYVKLTDEVDVFAYILYGFAFYIGLLFIYQWKRFIQIPFFISWWAFLFPSAAVTNATIYLYMYTGETFLRWIFPLQVVGLVVLTIYLTWKTLILAWNQKLCKKEE